MGTYSYRLLYRLFSQCFRQPVKYFSTYRLSYYHIVVALSSTIAIEKNNLKAPLASHTCAHIIAHHKSQKNPRKCATLVHPKVTCNLFPRVYPLYRFTPKSLIHYAFTFLWFIMSISDIKQSQLKKLNYKILLPVKYWNFDVGRFFIQSHMNILNLKRDFRNLNHFKWNILNYKVSYLFLDLQLLF